MGLGEENEPPKKKLKQAQLCFTPKSQKRKLVSDLDDDVQIIKIVCKESGKDNEKLSVQDKENQLSVPKPTSVDKKSKRESESSLNLLEATVKTKNGSESSNTEFVDNISTSPNEEIKETAAKTDSGLSSPKDDFSLCLSDSVFDTINCKSLPENELKVADGTLDLTHDSDEIEKTGSKSGDESDGKGDSTAGDNSLKVGTPNDSNGDDDCSITINSDDEGLDVSSSCDGSPDSKTTPPTPSTPSTSLKLTPKRLASIKKKEERDRLRQEKKAQRAKVKEEKIKQLEEEKRKRKEEKEKKRQEEQRLKDEEKKTREEERKKKEEERKQKEEEKKKKEEERRKREEAKEEEKRRKEEIEEKKKAAFAKFFKKKTESTEKVEEPEHEENHFMPFPMKPDMKLANVTRRILSDGEKQSLVEYISKNMKTDEYSYIKDLKSGKHTPLKSEATWPLSALEEEHDVVMLESTENGDCINLADKKDVNEPKKKTRAKLLQFHDNRRPPYWGTWRKHSKSVGPRRPLGQDKEIFDYEVDSDSEWEDEVEGEDIEKEDGADSDGEQSEDDEEANENGYVLDNTFVPHGYLSDEEVQPDEDVEDNDPENLKIRMKLLKQEFDEEMEKKTERLKPRLLGCVWISNITTEVSSGSLYEGLMLYRAVWCEEEGPIDVMGPVIEDSPTSTPSSKKMFPPRAVVPIAEMNMEVQNRCSVPISEEGKERYSYLISNFGVAFEVLPLLAKFVHESNLPMSSLVREFMTFIEKEHPTENVSKRGVTLKIKEIANKTYDYSTGKPTWAVHPTVCEEYGLKAFVPSMPAPAPIPPVLPIVEKPKEGPMLNFLKNVQTPPQVKKKVPFITLPKSQSFDYTPSKLNETGGIKNFGTPRPVDPALKKRAQLITLSTVSDNKPLSDCNTSLKTGTSAGEQNCAEPTVVCIDLCNDSQ